MQTAMLHFPYSFACQPFIDKSPSDCVTSSSPLSGSPSPPISNYVNRCYENIVTSRFRNHEDSTHRFTGLSYDAPKGYAPPLKKLFTIEAILGLNENKTSISPRTSLPTIITPPAENKDTTSVVRPTSHSNPHIQPCSVSVSSSNQSSKSALSNSGSQQKLSHGGGKMKRIRTIFTPEQLERLEMEFERQQYMVGPERMYLATSLGLSESQVKVWFQNRRIKFRKQHLEMQQARLAQLREAETVEGESNQDHISKEVSSTHWEDICDMIEERN